MPAKPLIIGHRGASAVAPENTIAAFRQSLECGADGVEFDVQLSRDGVPVIIHDKDLRRTGRVNKEVALLTASELAAIDVGSWFTNQSPDRQFATERVPTLKQLFELYRSRAGVLYLEMKVEPSQHVELAQLCCQHIQQDSLFDRVVVECFDLAAIEAVKRIDSRIKTAALFEPTLRSPRNLLGRDRLDRAREVGADEIALHHRLVTQNSVKAAKDTGLRVVVWTVDDPRWITRARKLGVDALITNDPATMLRHRDSVD